MAEHLPEAGNEQSEAVAANAIATIGTGPSFFMNQVFQHSVFAVQGYTNMNQILLTRSLERVMHTDIHEGSNSLLGMAVGTKIAQTVPPISSAPA